MILVARKGDKLLVRKWNYGRQTGPWYPVLVNEGSKHDVFGPLRSLVYGPLVLDPYGYEFRMRESGMKQAIRITEDEYLRFMLLWELGHLIEPPDRKRR